METLLTSEGIISLVSLAFMEIILGIDNVIFVSIIMGRMEKKDQLMARRIWMVVGIIMRISLLIGLGWLIKHGEYELINILGYGFNLRNIIMFAGGIFLLYKTVREIHHKLEGPEITEVASKGPIKRAFMIAIAQIIIIDMVFSFDSIITAIGLAKQVSIMVIAVVIAMIIMFLFSKNINDFIHKHPTFKMLALSFLLMIGFSLFFEGLHPLHHSEIPKGYIYFAMAFSFAVEILNMRLRKKMIIEQEF